MASIPSSVERGAVAAQARLAASRPQFESSFRLRMAVSWVLMAAVLAALAFGLLVPHVRDRLISLKRGGIADLTRVALGILDHYAAMAADGRMPPDDARRAAIAHLRRVRFGAEGRGCFWICDRGMRVLLYPQQPELEGRTVGDFTDDAGKRLFMAGARAVEGPQGAGFLDDGRQGAESAGPAVPEIFHARLFRPWGWIVGGGLGLEDVQRQVAMLKTRLIYGGLVLALIVLVLVVHLTRHGLRTERERRMVWKALIKRREEQRAILESSPHPVVVYDRQGFALYVNPAFSRTFGWSAEDVLAKRIDFVPAEEREKTLAAIKAAYDDGRSSIETRRLTKDGRLRDVYISAAAFRDDSGQTVGMVVNLVDITARKQTEEALRDSEEKYRNLVENASDAIFVTQDGVIKFPNRRMIEVSGYDVRSLAGLSFLDLLHPDDRSLIAERHRRRLNGQAVSNPVVFRGRNRGGDLLWLELNAVSVEWEGRPAVLNFLRDITDRKRLEAEIHQAQRLESLGTLAGGVAHDFNNLLMGIMGHTGLMRLDIAADHPHRQRLDAIEAHVQSGAELTRQLLGFARGGNYEMRPADLNRVVRDAASFFGGRHPEAAIRADLAPEPSPVEMDCDQIGRVLLNLLVNAWQSMPGGGQLTIATAAVTVSAEDAARHGIAPGAYARVTVSDTGIGMDEDTRRRIFEPFFTTRQMGHGAGLGLASAYGIVRNHGGIITVASQKGAGTVFDIYLPATGKPPGPDSSDRGDPP